MASAPELDASSRSSVSVGRGLLSRHKIHTAVRRRNSHSLRRDQR